jgi:hydroxymethylpyrimidine pyrophosphatase-like HAD family hydrolase
MKNKLLIFDLNGTLLVDGFQIPRYDAVKQIKYLISEGNKVIFITGMP